MHYPIDQCFQQVSIDSSGFLHQPEYTCETIPSNTSKLILPKTRDMVLALGFPTQDARDMWQFLFRDTGDWHPGKKITLSYITR